MRFLAPRVFAIGVLLTGCGAPPKPSPRPTEPVATTVVERTPCDEAQQTPRVATCDAR